MAGHHKFKNLTDKMSSERRARIEQELKKEMRAMLLSELRKAAGFTQSQVAKDMGVSQPALSQLENQSDMQISTLQRLVSSLGGELEIIASLPGQRVCLSQFAEDMDAK